MATNVDRFYPRDPWAVLAPRAASRPGRPDPYRVTPGSLAATFATVGILTALLLGLDWLCAVDSPRTVARFPPGWICTAYDAAGTCRQWSPTDTFRPDETSPPDAGVG